MLKEPLGTRKDQLSFFQISKETIREVKAMSQLRHLHLCTKWKEWFKTLQKKRMIQDPSKEKNEIVWIILLRIILHKYSVEFEFNNVWIFFKIHFSKGKHFLPIPLGIVQLHYRSKMGQKQTLRIGLGHV